MDNELGKWTDNMWCVLSRLPSSLEDVAKQRCRWDDLRSSEDLRTVIFGAYDAGKSTLLKRLLVDAGTEVPEWLTISGRRETFEVQSVQTVEGVMFVDTPGLSGGNDEHERISLDAMQLADAYLWVLPPQLVTADKQTFLDFASGRHFGGNLPASIVADATIAVVARMDEAGIDPADNPDGFHDLAAKKATELQALLHAGRVEADLRAVRCVSADPYQEVGNDPSPESELYDHGRDWDGVEALTLSLRSMLKERDILRAAAGARFVSRLASQARERLRDLIAKAEDALEACVNEIEFNRLIEQRLNALKRQAEAELHRGVEEALLHISRLGAESVANGGSTIEDSLSRVVDEWSDSCLADYRRLAMEAEVELKERMTRPSFAEFRKVQDYFQRLRGEEGTKDASFSTAKTVIKHFSELRKAVGDAVKASQLVNWPKVVNTAGPIVEQLSGVMLDVLDDIGTQQRAKERAQRRSELMAGLRQEARKIESQAAAGFKDVCKGFRQWLHERIKIFEDDKGRLKRRLEELRDGDRRLDKALQEFPD